MTIKLTSRAERHLNAGLEVIIAIANHNVPPDQELPGVGKVTFRELEWLPGRIVLTCRKAS